MGEERHEPQPQPRQDQEPLEDAEMESAAGGIIIINGEDGGLSEKLGVPPDDGKTSRFRSRFQKV